MENRKYESEHLRPMTEEEKEANSPHQDRDLNLPECRLAACWDPGPTAVPCYWLDCSGLSTWIRDLRVGAYGGWYNLVPPADEKSWKGRGQILWICGSMFAAGSGLITVGNFTAINLGGLQISLVLASAMLGLVGRLAFR